MTTAPFRLGLRKSLRRRGAFVISSRQRGWREILTHYGPLPIDVDAILRDKCSSGNQSVALRVEILRRQTERRERYCSRLEPVLVSKSCVANRGLKRGVISLRPLQGIPKRQGRQGR